MKLYIYIYIFFFFFFFFFFFLHNQLSLCVHFVISFPSFLFVFLTVLLSLRLDWCWSHFIKSCYSEAFTFRFLSFHCLNPKCLLCRQIVAVIILCFCLLTTYTIFMSFCNCARVNPNHKKINVLHIYTVFYIALTCTYIFFLY